MNVLRNFAAACAGVYAALAARVVDPLLVCLVLALVVLLLTPRPLRHEFPQADEDGHD